MLTLAELFWQASLDELKQGSIETENHFICLLCGKYFEKGIIYPEEGVLFEAKRYVQVHINHEHGSVFKYLLNLDKKLTGLTEHQKRLLGLFYAGKTDKEIQKELGIGSSSTIRNHRYMLKEKERQAKVFLALSALLWKSVSSEPDFIDPHPGATMIDERYNVTNTEEKRILGQYFPDGRSGKLKAFPRKEKIRLIILKELAQRFGRNIIYSEKQVDQMLKSALDDYVLLRRYLIDYGFMGRNRDGSQYWLIS